MREDRMTVKKMKSWLSSQHELTKALKDVHDRRFHHVDRKGTELDETLEKRYRELIGKIIEVENRLNLVSRAVITSAKPEVVKVVEKEREVERPPPKKPKKYEFDFETVWNDITKMIKKRGSIATLSRGVKNKILKITKNEITLRSELTKKERAITKEEFRDYWDVIEMNGKLNFIEDFKDDPMLLRLGSIMISFLARLPYIEYTLKPRMLYITKYNTHNLGTLKRRAKTI
jgi:hypothetical protein